MGALLHSQSSSHASIFSRMDLRTMMLDDVTDSKLR